MKSKRKMSKRMSKRMSKKRKILKGGNPLTNEIALDIWRGETYKLIQQYLKEQEPRQIVFGSKIYDTAKIIAKLKNQMKPMEEIRQGNYTFYRGDRNAFLTEESYNKNTFISISTDDERAQTYSNENNIWYTIQVDDDVFCLKVGIESEYLIDTDNCWIYQGDRHVRITTKNDNYPYYHELIENLGHEISNISDERSNEHNSPPTNSGPIHSGRTLLTIDNFDEDFADELNLKGSKSYHFDNFVNELNERPDIYWEPGTERLLWEKYQEIKN